MPISHPSPPIALRARLSRRVLYTLALALPSVTRADPVPLTPGSSFVTYASSYSSNDFSFQGGTLTLNGFSRNQPSNLYLASTPLTGSGTIQLAATGSTDGVNILPASSLPTATIGPNITIASASSYAGSLGSDTQSLHLLGPLVATIGTVYVKGPDWSLTSVQLAGNASVYLQGSFPTSRLPAIQRTGAGGNLIVDGHLLNSGATLDLDHTGPLSFTGSIQGGTITASSLSANLKPGLYADLDAVTLDFDWNAGSSTFDFRNSLTIANNHTLTFSGGSMNNSSSSGALPGNSIHGTGTIIFNAGGLSADTVDPGISIRTGTPPNPDTDYNVGLAVNQFRGTVTLDVPRITTILGGTNWVNTGTIALSAGTLVLGGSFAPTSVGNIVRTGGSVRVTGEVFAAGQSITLDASTGSWDFRNATVHGGILRTLDDAQFNVTSYATYGNVTTLDGVDAQAVLNVQNAATLQTGSDGLHLANRDIILFGGPSIAPAQIIGPLTGDGQILFNSPGSNIVRPASPFTYPAGISFRTLTGSGTIGDAAISVTVQGAILADRPGQTITLLGAPFTSAGSLTASNNAAIALNPAAFLNTGAADLASGTLFLIGSFKTADLRALTITAPNTLITGSLNNFNDTLAPSPARPFQLAPGSSVYAGTIATPTSSPLVITGPSTLTGPMTIAGSLRIPDGGLTFDGAITGAGGSISLNAPPSFNGSYVTFAHPSSLAGTLEFVFDGPGNSSYVRPTVNFTFSPGITIRTGVAGGTVGYTAALNNAGAISSQTAGKTINLFGPSISNTGDLRATAGGILNLSTNVNGPTNFTNAGTLTIGPSSTVKLYGTLQNTSTISLAGTLLFTPTYGTSPTSYVVAQILAGRAGLPGIVNPLAANDPTQTIGYLTGKDVGPQFPYPTYLGIPIDPTTLILKAARFGDANLNGKIDPDDYARLDRGRAKALTGWSNGDFNYDDAINSADYLLIDLVYIQQGTPLSPDFRASRESQFGPAYVSSLLTSLPEPSLPACLFAASLLPPRRRRRH